MILLLIILLLNMIIVMIIFIMMIMMMMVIRLIVGGEPARCPLFQRPYTRSPLEDSRLFGRIPWKVLRHYL